MSEIEKNKNLIDEKTIKNEKEKIEEEFFYGDPKLKNFYDFSKKSIRAQIICFVLFFLIIPILVLLVYEWVWTFKAITVTLDDPKISKSATRMGVLSFLLVPPIITGSILNSKIKKNYPNIKKKLKIN